MNESADILNKYRQVYQPLVSNFIQEAKGINLDGMPEPFLPVLGTHYVNSDVRIAVVGMETNGWGKLQNFIDRHRSTLEVDEYEGFDEGNMIGERGLRTFWNFVTKFLAVYHGTSHQELLEDPEKLQSFVWGNCNSIEAYSVTAQANDVQQGVWQAIKRASLRFDHGKHLIDVFSPDVLLVMWWSPDESYLTEMMGPVKVRRVIDNHLLYIELEKTNTRVIWTAHPSSLRRDGIEDSTLDHCVRLAKHGLRDDSA